MSNIKIYLNKNIRIYTGDFTKVAQKAIEIQKPTPLPSLVLATAISTFGTYSALRVGVNMLAVFQVNGAIKTIIVDTKHSGEIKALVGNKFITTDYDNKDINEIPLKVATGEVGTLHITNSVGQEKFGSQVKMAKGDIVTDLAWYLDQSDQVKSVVVTNVYFKDKKTLEKAETIIIQMLPGHSEEEINFVEDIIKKNKLSELGLEKMVKLLKGEQVGEKNIFWKADFSKEKAKKVVSTISLEEQKEIIKENGFIEIKDEFSNVSYKFDKPIKK